MQKITPFLWYDGKAEDAAKFYVSIFKKDSKITGVMRMNDGSKKKQAPVMSVSFRLRGQDLIAFNGGPQFQFSSAFSLFVSCKDQKEVDYFWEKLSAGGEKQPCGWLKDKFGLSWQVIPRDLPALLAKPGGLQAMLQMKKIDIKALKTAIKIAAKGASKAA